MEFSVKRSDLLDELELTQGVVERKTTIPILSNLLVEAKGSRLTITATDLDLKKIGPARRTRTDARRRRAQDHHSHPLESFGRSQRQPPHHHGHRSRAQQDRTCSTNSN